MKTLLIYDNAIHPSDIICEVIGQRGFGDVIVKRHLLKSYYMDNIKPLLPVDTAVKIFNQVYDYDAFIHEIEAMDDKDVRVLHCFADFIINDVEKIALTVKKLPFINENIKLASGRQMFGVMFANLNDYKKFLIKSYSADAKSSVRNMDGEELQVEGVQYIGEIDAFVQCISGNFDSRYFNSLKGTRYSLRKSSTNKKKIKAEYQYYHLLPEEMQRFMVMPYDYKEDDETASYAMERLYMTDIAIKWVHGSFDEAEFEQLMDMYFYFFSERKAKDISSEEYAKISDDLYVKKVVERIQDLKQLEAYKPIASVIDSKYGSIDNIINRYLELKKKVEAKVKFAPVSVIGHGDPCFANAMYNRATRTLKFIDPKGAVTEEGLWTNPYYDIAKLSHSVCGNYDFFNNAMFDISLDENFNYQLTIPFDNSPYKAIFKNFVEDNGYDYWTVRLYEASLFLSMLPLHIDYPQKVLGFLLNAIHILDEVEENV